MRSLLRLPAVIALSLTVLVGCSGDDEEPQGSGEPTTGAESDLVGHETSGCRAEVEITGAVEAAWSGKAQVRRSSSEPTAVYTATHRDASISAFSEAGDSTATANVTVDGKTYTTPLGDDTGLEIRADGSGADIDADAIGIEGPGVHIDATFDCPEPEGQAGDRAGEAGDRAEHGQQDG